MGNESTPLASILSSTSLLVLEASIARRSILCRDVASRGCLQGRLRRRYLRPTNDLGESGDRRTFLIADHLERDAPEHCHADKFQSW